jgi:hypothetical protein
MSGRRENTTHDRQRNSTARKEKHRRLRERAQQQAEVVQRLWNQAKAEAKAAASEK